MLLCETPGAVKMESSVSGEVGGENYPQWALDLISIVIWSNQMCKELDLALLTSGCIPVNA